MRRSIKTIMCMMLGATLWIVPAFTVLAGNINSHEQRVINASMGPFYYDGIYWVPTDDACEQLRSYLEQDDVDLTKEQADEAIAIGIASVPDGIAQGHLVPMEGQEPQEPTQPTEPTQPEPQPQPQPQPQPSQPVPSEPSKVTEPTESAEASAEVPETEASEESLESQEASIEAADESAEESTEATEESVEANSEEAPEKDLSDKSFEKGVDILPIALGIAAIVLAVAIIIVVKHKMRFTK